jgi:hypothetical protein
MPMPPELPPPFIVGETYSDRLGDYRVISLEGNRLVLEYADGRRSEGTVEQKALIYRNILREQNNPRPINSVRSPSPGTRSGHFFTHDKVFPIIAEIIESQSAGSRDYVTHDRIVDGLLKHKEAQLFLAGCPKDESRTESWWAHCMVAWFSKVFTDGRSEWSTRFERKKIKDKWAYKVAVQFSRGQTAGAARL